MMWRWERWAKQRAEYIKSCSAAAIIARVTAFAHAMLSSVDFNLLDRRNWKRILIAIISLSEFIALQ